MTDHVSVVVPVYRDWQRAAQLVSSLTKQTLPAETELDIVVVDDGSNDGGSATIDHDARVTLVTLPENVGRAAARNAGFDVAKGRIVVFMDCDCLPGDENTLAAHLEAMRQETVASTGHVFGKGGGFWDRYQQRASLRRALQHRQGVTYSGSSQNLAVLAEAFRTVKGFDARYRHYGFEDRDLLLRLSELGRLAWSEGSPVIHTDKLHLDVVAWKMTECARYSAPLFALDHPDAYRALGYARVDSRLHAWLRLPARVAGPLAMPLARWLDATLQLLPFVLSAALVSAISALAFLHGSAIRETKAAS